MRKFLIIIEKTKSGFSAYSPDLEGFIATGATKRAVKRSMRDAIIFHLKGLKQDGLKIPSRKSYSTYLEVSAHS